MHNLIKIISTFTLFYALAGHAECEFGEFCNPKDTTIDAFKLKPLPSIDLPPVGTTSCSFELVGGKWTKVCR